MLLDMLNTSDIPEVQRDEALDLAQKEAQAISHTHMTQQLLNGK